MVNDRPASPYAYESSVTSSPQKVTHKASTKTSKQIDPIVESEKSDLERLEHIRKKMDKHVGSSHQMRPVISSAKHKILTSKEKTK